MEIRWHEGRARPIDVLCKELELFDDCGVENNFGKPAYEIFKGLTVKEMEELRLDMKLQLEMQEVRLDRKLP